MCVYVFVGVGMCSQMPVLKPGGAGFCRFKKCTCVFCLGTLCSPFGAAASASVLVCVLHVSSGALHSALSFSNLHVGNLYRL